MKHFIERFKAETPEFWKKVQKFMLLIGAMATAIWTINANMGLDLHPYIITVCKYTLAVCAAITLSSQFTIKSSTDNG